MAVMLPFVQLWGPDGTIMRMLSQALPGIQLYLILIAGLLTFFYLRRIKDPESGLHDIFSFILVIGGISLLVFGNLIILLVIEGMFIGGYYFLHHVLKEREHLSSAEQAVLTRFSPAEAQAFDRTRRAAHATGRTHSPAASTGARMEEDLATAEETLAAGEAASQEMASAASGAVNAEERAAAVQQTATKNVQQAVAQLTAVLPKLNTPEVTDAVTRKLLADAARNIQQFCTTFINAEIDKNKLLIEETYKVLSDDAVAREVPEHVSNLIPVIENLSQLFGKKFGSEMLEQLEAKLTHDSKELTTLHPAPTPSNDVTAFFPGAVENPSDIQTKIAVTQSTISQIKDLRRQMLGTLDTIQRSLANVKKELSTLAKTTINSKQLSDAVARLEQQQTILENALRAFNTAMDNAERADSDALQIPITLESGVRNLFSTFINAHMAAHAVLQELLAILKSAQARCALEEQAWQKINNLGQAFSQMQKPLDTIWASMAGSLGTSRSEASLAQNAISALNLDEQKTHQKSVNDTARIFAESIRDVQKEIEVDSKRDNENRQAITSILNNLGTAFKAIAKKETTVAAQMQQNIKDAQEKMVKVQAAAIWTDKKRPAA